MALLSITIVASFSWQLYQNWMLLRHDEKTELNPIERTPDYKAISESALEALNTSLFGQYIPVTEPSHNLEPIAPIPVKTTAYTLQAIYFSQHRKLSAISIVTGQKDNLYWENDELVSGVIVDKIEPDHVLLKQNGRLEQLFFDTASQKPPLPPPIITMPNQPKVTVSKQSEADQQTLQSRLERLRDQLDKSSG